MKLLKTTLLASAVAMTFGATAELTAMTDASLEDVTGQAGFTIQNTFATNGINIYLGDSDGVSGAAGATAGWLAIQNLKPTGAMDIDFDGSDRSINIKNAGVTNIEFDLAVANQGQVDSGNVTFAANEVMAKVKIQLPAGMGTKITAH